MEYEQLVAENQRLRKTLTLVRKGFAQGNLKDQTLIVDKSGPAAITRSLTEIIDEALAAAPAASGGQPIGTASLNKSGMEWNLQQVNLMAAISALKGYVTTTGPGTPKYFERLREHYIGQIEKAASAFLPAAPANTETQEAR